MDNIPNVIPPHLVEQCIKDVALVKATVDDLYQGICKAAGIISEDRMSDQITTWDDEDRSVLVAFNGDSETLCEVIIDLDTGNVRIVDPDAGEAK
jgi:hypothetical protein